uniref:Family with sequence similarity 98 member B n=1 Tax=Hucho hucho TaxID=62062 RepID=A0A4W5MVS7_9TELE
MWNKSRSMNTFLKHCIYFQINAVLQELPKDHIGKPVLKNSPNSEQWERLEQINTVLSSEYECRRRMLIKRLDVTVQSFGWSERAKAGGVLWCILIVSTLVTPLNGHATPFLLFLCRMSLCMSYAQQTVLSVC